MELEQRLVILQRTWHNFDILIRYCVMTRLQGMDELISGTTMKLNGVEPKASVFSYPLPFNLIPHIDSFQVRSSQRIVVCATRDIAY